MREETVLMPPIITLTTDFGTRDGYIGAMKGVIFSHAPSATVTDITHDVPPQNIRAGGWAVRNAWPWFPAGTIHVIVVDPGVGSARRSIAVLAADQIFIGPDNGVIPLALGETPPSTVHEITSPDAMAPEPSATFHGRDVFSWGAGWFAAGNALVDVGPEVATDELVRIKQPEPQTTTTDQGTIIEGRVLVADRFGNLITTIPNKLLPDAVDRITATVDGSAVPFGRTFTDVPSGAPVVYAGSSDQVEVAVNLGSAEKRFGTDAHITIRVC